VAVNSRKLTREDVAFVLELRSESISWKKIAYWVFNITGEQLIDRMKTWGAI